MLKTTFSRGVQYRPTVQMPSDPTSTKPSKVMHVATEAFLFSVARASMSACADTERNPDQTVTYQYVHIL